jgi:alkylhydroperoxidase family enzyme
MLRFAERLTVEPAATRAGHVEELRAAGFGDADVLAIVEVTSYYAYANRIADGLGVALEEG